MYKIKKKIETLWLKTKVKNIIFQIVDENRRNIKETIAKA